jgi:3-oxoadipate enol-lactonase
VKIRVGGTQLNVQMLGESGVPVLLLHGLGGSHASWGSIPRLLARSRRVVCPDLRGCGESELGDAPYSLALLARDCIAVLDALAVNRCHVIGHSLGGVVAQELLTGAPGRFASAVLVSTSSRVGQAASEGWRRLADSVEKRGLGSPEGAVSRGFSKEFAEANPTVIREHGTLATACDPAVYAAQARAASSYDYGDGLATVTIPVLVLQGLADRLTTPGGSVLLSRALPNATLEMIEGVGHNLHLELGEKFAETVETFMRRAEAPHS